MPNREDSAGFYLDYCREKLENRAAEEDATCGNRCRGALGHGILSRRIARKLPTVGLTHISARLPRPGLPE
jgi:hypothetical protein